MQPLEPSQMNIYQGNTYKKDISWLHFDDEPREVASEGPTVLHISFCNSLNISKKQLGAAAPT